MESCMVPPDDMPPTSDPLSISGTVLADKYRIDKVVGEGGFAVVYRAEHLIWKQPVAIKCFRILSSAPEAQRQDLLDGFIQEGKLMTSLSSKTAAIVQARDVGTFTAPNGDWVPYMVLEWLEGKSLDVVLWEERQAGLPLRTLPEAMALIEPAASALEVVHGMNIAHRDIKPANFFVIGDARSPGVTQLKLLDFGIAKVMAEHAQLATSLAQTTSTVSAFTPNYGSPEQFSRTHGATGPWSDVFAMALVLLEILRGVPALEGDDYLQLAIAARDETRRPSPRALGLQVSDTVEAVFLKALAVSPKDRYRTMGEFFGDLHLAVFDTPWSGGGGAMTRQPGFTLQVGPGAPASAATVAFANPTTTTGGVLSAASPATSPAGGSGKIVAGVVGALAVAGIVGFVAFRSASQNGGPTPTASTEKAAPSSSAALGAPTTCADGMVMIPGGSFFEGSDDEAFKLSQPAHRVTLSTFCIDLTEVTVAAYKACSDKGRCKRPDREPSYPKSDKVSAEDHDANRKKLAPLCNFYADGRDDHPINCVSWTLADNFCKERGGRLPSEAEWEFAARGSDGRKFPWGDDTGVDAKHMNACGAECVKWAKENDVAETPKMYDSDDGFPGTAPVGSFPAGKTKHGLSDMVGNVWEWTNDWFSVYGKEEVANPTGAGAGDKKAIRGGGFNGGDPLWVSPAYRYHQVPAASVPGIGFRCAMSLEAK